MTDLLWTSVNRIEIDPDLLQPNDTASGQVRHWVQSNIVLDPTELDKDGQVTGKYTEEAITEYLPSSPGPPGHKHRYVFCLARQSPDHPAPSASDFPKGSAQTTATSSNHKDNEDVKDRARFSLEEYLEKRSLKVVAATFIKVGPDAEGLMDNALLSGEAIVNKVLGK
jgi:hypothetical protein